MAISSLPSNFLPTPSPTQSLFFPRFHPQTRPRKLRISSCQQTVRIDHETKPNANLVKKKRKPRPSFLEQVQTKWSLKIPSSREKFPWQEQESCGANQEVQQQFSPDVNSVKGSEKSSSVSDPDTLRTKIRSILAPWVHGNESRKEARDFEGAGKCQESVRRNAQGLDGFHEHRQDEESVVRVIQSSDDLVKHDRLDCRSERKGDELDKIPFLLPEKNEKLGSDESKSVTLGSSTIHRNIYSMKSSVGTERLPWERKAGKESVKNDNSWKSNTELAERLIPEHELKRLRNVSLRMVERIKVGAAGVTQALVDAIHDKWKQEEVIKLKFEGPPSKNMKRTHEILESRTGGLVIYRSGSSVALYRGLTYKFECIKSYSKQAESPQSISVKHLNVAAESSGLYNSTYFKNLSEEEQMDLSELNLLLDDLGPRFIDWSGRGPLPVDADLLPSVVPGYKTPFRLLPHGSKQALRDKEMTYIRREARNLPPHFALGRSRELQGLASAMVKLWEKSAIAKIAIKRGVQNTSNERMAEELKEFQHLTGQLNFIPGLTFSTDAPLFDFLTRVPNLDAPTGPPESHPWLNLFIPKSRISDFNAGVLAAMLPRLNQTSGIFIFYPLNKNKWNDSMTAVTPDEDVFYTLALLHTSRPQEYRAFDEFNGRVLEFCRRSGIKVKQYLPNISSQRDWMEHFGWKWGSVVRKKAMFDPKRILSPGQRMFSPV